MRERHVARFEAARPIPTPRSDRTARGRNGPTPTRVGAEPSSETGYFFFFATFFLAGFFAAFFAFLAMTGVSWPFGRAPARDVDTDFELVDALEGIFAFDVNFCTTTKVRFDFPFA